MESHDTSNYADRSLIACSHGVSYISTSIEFPEGRE